MIVNTKAMLGGVFKRSVKDSMRVYLMICAFGVSVFALIYWNYPFDGMIVEESWALYPQYPSGDNLSAQTEIRWYWPFSKRGGSYLILDLLVSVGSTPRLVNALCIAAQVVNLVFFAFIAWKLGGPARLFPILMAALLYPFASSMHFWQIGLLHHLAVMVFFTAFMMFLRVSWSPEFRVRDLLFYGLPSLVLFWLSLGLMEHAMLMPVLFIYLALYNSNDRLALLRFKRLWSPSVAFALCYLAISLVFVGLAIFANHSRLTFLSPTNASRFTELASLAHIPPIVVTGAVVGVNAILFFSAAILANSLGYLGYPFMSIVEHASVLMDEAKYWSLGVGLVACLGTWGLYILRSRQSHVSDREVGQSAFLVTVGLLWALLAYLPMSSSFAYARVVGHIADRTNALALFGVSLCLGVAVTRLTAAPTGDHPIRTGVVFAGCFAGITILLLNLYIQREYWIEGYRKERQVITEVLNGLGQERFNGRKPIVLLDRDRRLESVRSRLDRALEEPGAMAKMLNVAKVVLARHFTKAGEIEVTSFHFGGVPLFGGGQESAAQVFNNYARQLSLNPVPVYKMDYGVKIKEDADQISIGYGSGPETSYSKHEYYPVILSLEESYFQFRGAASYQLKSSVTPTGLSLTASR